MALLLLPLLLSQAPAGAGMAVAAGAPAGGSSRDAQTAGHDPERLLVTRVDARKGCSGGTGGSCVGVGTVDPLRLAVALRTIRERDADAVGVDDAEAVTTQPLAFMAATSGARPPLVPPAAPRAKATNALRRRGSAAAAASCAAAPLSTAGELLAVALPVPLAVRVAPKTARPPLASLPAQLLSPVASAPVVS